MDYILRGGVTMSKITLANFDVSRLLADANLTYYGAALLIGAKTDENLGAVQERLRRWAKQPPQQIEDLHWLLEALEYEIEIKKRIMTFEEIQQAIEGLLSVQRNLQEGDLRMQSRQQATEERLDRLTNITERYIDASTGVIERLDQTVERLDQTVERLDRNFEELRASNQRLDQSVEELKASNRRQERINDFLLRHENGAPPEE